MLWDYDAVLRIIHASRAVVAVICAHDHDGGYHRDAAGVHHLTLRSPLNRGAAGSAFGAVSERVCLGGGHLMVYNMCDEHDGGFGTTYAVCPLYLHELHSPL